MFKSKYFLHCVLFYTFFSRVLFAYEGHVSYEKYYRLNKPLYRSNSGDLINFSYASGPIPEEKKLDVYGMGDLKLYFQDNNSINYSLQEAYARYKNENYTLYIGRKILDWNVNEKYWSLGYLNANQAFTLLSTEEEGVTGILLNKKYDRFEFDILLSYIFIPQLNPSIDFKNGEVRSKSDWVRLPPKNTVVNGVEVPIYYNTPNYNVSRIVFNKSLGANLRYRWNKGGLSAFAIYKPENRLRANAGAYYDNLTLNQVVVDTAPTVNHHAYYGVQIFQDFGDVKTRGGLSYVDPNASLGKDFPVGISNARKTFKSDYFTINPRYDKEAYSHFSVNLDRKVYQLSLNYIHLISKNTRDGDDFFSDSVKWQRAFGGSALVYLTDSFNVLVDFKYDIARFDNILKCELKYNYKNLVNVALGLEILKAPRDTSYWSYYRADDTLYSSIGLYF
ncbi:MAG: hypothetical protein KBD76_05670 [Bacteriovorax sp.]|nr:hypothetical protein [Bacteriovorax sp.]